MVRRRHRRRKRFACGHSGFGRWCHRCAVPQRRSPANPQPSTAPPSRTATRARTAARQQAAKRRWQRRFLHDPIPLTLQPKPIVLKTR
ncbi:MAG: hypothetical protein ACFB8W_09130 [Elainellaceae cyanobacterium]